MHEKYEEDVTIVGIAGRDELDAIVAFVDDLGVGDFPHAVDSTGEIWRAYGVSNQPSFYFINDDGAATGFVGGMGVDGMSENIDILLNS